MNSKQIAIVTGSYRGIGFETVRALAAAGCHVIMTARQPQRANEALQQLLDEGLSVELRKLDVTSTEECKSLADYVRQQYKGVDILVNNAGILPESRNDQTGRYSSNPLRIPVTSLMEIINTNTFGAVRMIQAFALLLRPNARIVNVSSVMGQLARGGTGYLGYRMSKTALNSATRIFAEEFAGKNIKVNSVCPGWVKTAMGGENSDRTPAEGAASVVWAALLPEDGPTGGFFRDGKQLEW